MSSTGKSTFRGNRAESGPQVTSNMSEGRQSDNATLSSYENLLDQCKSNPDTQQFLLDGFRNAFSDLLDEKYIKTSLEPKLQNIKHHLYRRDFQTAFGDYDSMRVYAARWSPPRALAYREIFEAVSRDIHSEVDRGHGLTNVNWVCIGGGGGAEIAALVALLESGDYQKMQIVATIVDIADWSTVIEQLPGALLNSTSSPNATQKRITTTSIIQNVLDSDSVQSGTLQKSLLNADIVTIFFTLNELFTDSLPKTQTFLLSLTHTMKKGSRLVVLDSAGSYSSVGLGSKLTCKESSEEGLSKRKYPMAWLLDHVLLKLATQIDAPKTPPWRKIFTSESRWFRPPEDLSYPLKLENMRYQLHVFELVA